MKSFLYLVAIFLISACGKVTQSKINQSDNPNQIEKENDYGYKVISEKDFPIILKCEGIKDSIRNNDEFRRIDHSMARCISDRAFLGAKEYESQLLFILENSGYPILVSKFSARKNKFRGKKIFNILLEKANNFNCYTDHDGHFTLSINSIYKNYLKDMVKTINGYSYDTYIRDNTVWPDNLYDIIDDNKINNCDQLIAKYTYLCLVEANKKGLISLKSYGEN